MLKLGMLINGNVSPTKTSFLIQKYVELLNSGINASEVLVLLSSSNLKSNFTNKVLEKLNVNVVENFEIHSFFGLVYNTVSNNWAYLENMINDSKTHLLPNLTGLEISQFILKDIIKDIKFKGYNSKKSLLHQLFRRYSLIVQNNLSEKDVKWRCENVLNESFSDDAALALKTLISKTLHLRSFDYLRQTIVFKHIYENTRYFKNIKYVLIDDADEITPACFEFIKSLKPQLKDFFIAYDEKGSSRCGYLSATNNISQKLSKHFKSELLNLNDFNKLSKDAETLFTNVLENKFEKLTNLEFYSPSKRAEMIDLAILKVKELINSGIKPSEISIITPVIDEMLKFSLKEQIQPHIAELLFISGSEKLIQNSIVLSALNVLKLNSELKSELSEFDLRSILQTLLSIPIKYCKEILENFEKDKTFIDFEFHEEIHNKKYQAFKNLLEEIKALPLSEQAFLIYKKLPNINNFSTKELAKFNFFVKELKDFENVFDKKTLELRKNEILNQIENSIIAENPASTLNIKETDLTISTFQKIIDNKLQTKYQIWLDTSSSEWIKSDTGPLYNSWVFQSDWGKKTYTVEDNILLSKQKIARTLRKLALLTTEKIYAYGSLYDSNGVENYGGIEKYLNYEKGSTQPRFQITPREDQKPILKYAIGQMAISAVPGAGKTTILLALILKLIEDKIAPENIYVLTYMESAARNFKEKIKNIYQDSAKLPNISTIHGLALKILKDNSNFERLGYSSDFEICDDSQRARILQTLSNKFHLKKTEFENFERALSIFKLSKHKNTNPSINPELDKFYKFFNEYELLLKEANLIDYDDMLLSTITLLENNEDILNHYQENCKYIIEDEAQDSSAIQQRMIELLSSKHKNLVRCGDINQAITSTFSNADTEGFKQFIKNSTAVEMNCSQRCCKDIWTLANKLITWAENKPEYKNSFYKIFMQPVENKNPISENAIVSYVAENELSEKNFILNQIKNILTKEPTATIGILLRYNFQIAPWQNIISDAGLKTLTRSDSLQQKAVFKAIFAVLRLIEKPFDNDSVAKSYETLAELGFYKQRLHLQIKEQKVPFIQLNADEISNIYLNQFYWDFNYWLSVSNLPIDELATKIGVYYFSTNIEKSNVYLISTLIKRIATNNNDFGYVTKRLEELSLRPNFKGFQFFTEEDEKDKNLPQGKIQIMTYHKSKGDEFDYVFLPEFNETQLNLDFEKLKLKKNSDFLEKIRMSDPNYKVKSDNELKSEIISENLRLLYVAITRAKRKLYFTVSKIKKLYGKEVSQDLNTIFNELLKVGTK